MFPHSLHDPARASADHIYHCSPLPEVVIRGPAEGIVNQEIRFTAEANLTSKTPPYEYEWYTDDGGTKTHQSNRLTDEETFVWETSGKN